MHFYFDIPCTEHWVFFISFPISYPISILNVHISSISYYRDVCWSCIWLLRIILFYPCSAITNYAPLPLFLPYFYCILFWKQFWKILKNLVSLSMFSKKVPILKYKKSSRNHFPQKVSMAHISKSSTLTFIFSCF